MLPSRYIITLSEIRSLSMCSVSGSLNWNKLQNLTQEYLIEHSSTFGCSSPEIRLLLRYSSSDLTNWRGLTFISLATFLRLKSSTSYISFLQLLILFPISIKIRTILVLTIRITTPNVLLPYCRIRRNFLIVISHFQFISWRYLSSIVCSIIILDTSDSGNAAQQIMA